MWSCGSSWFGPGSVLIWSWFSPCSVLVWSWLGPGLILVWSWFGVVPFGQHGSKEYQYCLTWDREVSIWDSLDLVPRPAGCGAWIYDRKCICLNAKVSVKEWNTHGQLPGLWDLMVVLYWQTVVYVRTEFRIFRIFKFSFKLNFKYSIFWLLVDGYVKQSFDSCITNDNECYPMIQKILMTRIV